MSPTAMMLIIFAAFLVVLLSGHPLAFTLGGLAIIFAVTLWGATVPWALFIRRTTDVMTHFVYVSAPLFIFMAALLQRSGTAEHMFESLHIVLGKLKGGLALSTVVICTLLAASTGIIGASITMMGMLALPTMLKRGYNKELATGTIMAGGCLGTIIPPSIILIIYGAQANLSIGKLFMGGVGSGLVLSALYMTYIALICRLKPDFGPPIEAEELARYSITKILRMTLISVIPPLALIIAVLGSIFIGAATPTEAAAVGAFGAIIVAAAYRRLNWNMVKESCYVTIKTTAMVFWIILGATLFTSVFLGLGGGEAVSNLVLGISANRWVILGFILFLLLIMGMLIDCYGILLIGIPLFTPIAYSLGFDPIWFGLLFCIMIQASYLTPPFAYAIFFLKAISPPEITTGVLYRAVIPFIGLQLIGLIICIVFPAIITWLPGLM